MGNSLARTDEMFSKSRQSLVASFRLFAADSSLLNVSASPSSSPLTCSYVFWKREGKILQQLPWLSLLLLIK